jgi:hypothetical protein
MKYIYQIEIGDKFLCKKDYIMDDESIAYKEGVTYTSNKNGCITDEQGIEGHGMNGEYDFFEYFELLPSI